VDFGAAGYSDYTLHGDAARMRNYVRRHGGIIPATVERESSPSKIRAAMRRVIRSRNEKWGRNGMRTPGFWSRWLLWSEPSLAAAGRTTARALGRTVRILR
jgi:hypothetical protein